MSRPNLFFLGPHVGRHPGWVTTQGEILADLFRAEGYPVRAASSRLRPALRLIDFLSSLLRHRRWIDVVIVSVFSGRGFFLTDVASRLAAALGLPQVMVLRGGAFREFTARHPARVDRTLARARALVAPSGFLRDFFADRGHRVEVIPNVLALDAYPFRRRERVAPRLLWVRTFHPIYHPDLAIDVLAELRGSGVDASLTMAGQDKGLLGATRELARQRGLADHVRFPGFLDPAGKRREFAAHDVFLNTNRVDNMPVTVLEAAAFGLPVVATRVGGIPYLLDDGETALLVDEDAGRMAAAVRRLLAEPELARRLSDGGRRLAESCAWPVVHRRWQRLFAEL